MNPAKVLNGVRRRERVRTVNSLPSMTVQDDVVRSEIKHILERHSVVGIVEHLREVDLTFRDVSEFEDFADMARQSKEAEKVFLKLPSKVREVFGHDVMKWLDAAHDPEKLEVLRPKLEKLGVMEPKTVAVQSAPDGRVVDRRKIAELSPDPNLVERRKPRVVVPKP